MTDETPATELTVRAMDVLPDGRVDHREHDRDDQGGHGWTCLWCSTEEALVDWTVPYDIVGRRFPDDWRERPYSEVLALCGLTLGDKLSDNERAEGGAEAASATSASAKWVLDHQQPPSAPVSPAPSGAGAALAEVEAVHQIHGDQCLCGFSSAVSRDRTRHIAAAAVAALAPSGAGAALAEAYVASSNWPIAHAHDPDRKVSCTEADRAADEQIAGLEAALERVRALADEWDEKLRREFGVGPDYTDWHSREVRAALSPSPGPDEAGDSDE